MKETNTAIIEPRVISAKQAASILGISKPKMYELTRHDDFPKLKVGKRILIPYQRFLEWIDTASAERRHY
jgi:excisionase family DNA binding protein